MDTSESALLADAKCAGGPAVPPLKIFINYRHDDIPFAAWTLYRELKGRFGEENIFFDQGTLQPGMQFLQEIKSHLEGTGAFLALIGPKWMTTMLGRRQRSDEDYVAKEIDLALRHGWAVIPVLVDDASLPDLAGLPPAIRALRGRQVARLRQTSLVDDVHDLRVRLDKIRDAGDGEPGVPGKAVINAAGGSDEAREPAGDFQPADEDHYRMLFDEADNLVIFLGAGANAGAHEEEAVRQGAEMLPDDTALAEYLAAKVKMRSGERDLAGVAQYVRMIRGEPNVFKWVKEILGAESAPGPVHRYLARLPRRLEELGLEKRYQMIVTPTFDVALERAFRDEGEPFDVAVYMARGTEYAGRFVHVPWESADPRPVLTPNEYTEFPFVTDYGELTHTVIVRTNGAVDDLAAGYRWKRNFVITEDHYIDYLRGRPAEEVVPTQILAKLRQASCLFLGYPVADWPLRVFLHWIWPGESLTEATHWAVEHDPDELERQFWQHFGVCLYGGHLTDYLSGFDRFLTEHREELT